MKILIIRHAEPDYANNTLTEKGFKEAAELSERLEKIKIDDIYSSPFERAVYTAEPTAQKHNKDVVVLDWLKEFHGKCIDEVSKKEEIPWNLMPQFWNEKKEFYDIHSWLNEEWMKSGTVEKQYKYVTQEFDKLLNEYGFTRKGIIYECVQNTEKTIVLFCHFALGMILVSHLSGISPVLLWQTMFLPTSSVTTFVTEERKKGKVVFRCMQLGDTSHLYANNDEISKSGLFPEFYGGEGQGPIV